MSIAWVLLFWAKYLIASVVVSKFKEGKAMKPMIWHPESKDRKVNEYLDQTNREPWLAILAGVLVLVCAFTLLVLLGAF